MAEERQHVTNMRQVARMPDDGALVIAYRGAMRTLPLLANNKDKSLFNLAQPIFRCILTSGALAVASRPELRGVARSASLHARSMMFKSIWSLLTSDSAGTAYNAAYNAAVAVGVNDRKGDKFFSAKLTAGNFAQGGGEHELQASVSADIYAYEKTLEDVASDNPSMTRSDVESLTAALMRSSRIWFTSRPDQHTLAWNWLRGRLINHDSKHSVWLDWCDQRMQGWSEVDAIESDWVLLSDDVWREDTAAVLRLLKEIQDKHKSQVSLPNLTAQPTSNVFLSYDRRNHERATEIAGRLERAGVFLWWDRRLIAGDIFHVEIRKQIDAASVVIVLWTKESATSQWVYAEAQHGAGKVISVLGPGFTVADVPLPFGTQHVLDFNDIEGLRISLKDRGVEFA